MGTVRTFRFILAGLGRVGRSFLELIREREQTLCERYGVRFLPVGVADSSGAAHADAGLDLDSVIAIKRARMGASDLRGVGHCGMDTLELLETTRADLYLDASPTEVKDAHRSIARVRSALMRGLPTVLATKGPLALAFQEIADLSDLRSPEKPPLRFSGSVCGAMPVVNLGMRDLACSYIARAEGVLNLTTQIMLSMMRDGRGYDAALVEAQRLGIAEHDPSLDVEGYDSASKLVIVSNAVLAAPAQLSDVSVTGIRGVSEEDFALSRTSGRPISLVASAERLPDQPDRYRLSVAPKVLARDHPLARLTPWEMGIVYESDIYGTIEVISAGQRPMSTSAAMLRDVLDIARGSLPRGQK